MFKLYDIVKLKKDDDVHGVKESFTGTIVDVQAGGKAFTVEFIDEKGETVEPALFADYKPDEIDLVQSVNI